MLVPPSRLMMLLMLVSAVDSTSTTPGPTKAEEITLQGKVITLSEAMQSRGIDVKADPEPIAKQVVLLGEDGTITPIFSDDASRALFRDERLRGCRCEIRGRRFAGVPYLQVITFQVERDGRLQMAEYYCEVCSISVRYPQICPCCQGPMELRLKPGPR